MAKHDIKSARVWLDALRGNGGTISADKPIRQTEQFDYDDFDLITKWYAKSLISDSVEPIDKTGADVDSNGDLDLSADNVPEIPRNPTVYVDNIVGGWQTQYDKSTKKISGLYGVDPSSIIQIIF